MARPKKTDTTGTQVVTKVATQIKAVVDKKHFGRNGNKLSKEITQYFNIQEWKQFQQHGARQGWFLVKVLESPEGVDTSYTNPK